MTTNLLNQLCLIHNETEIDRDQPISDKKRSNIFKMQNWEPVRQMSPNQNPDNIHLLMAVRKMVTWRKHGT